MRREEGTFGDELLHGISGKQQRIGRCLFSRACAD
jgi:hypothetical protein